MIRSIRAHELKPGDVLALPMGKTATVSSCDTGTKFVTFVTEHGISRVEKTSDVLLEVTEGESA
jgi:hypothetical protein